MGYKVVSRIKTGSKDEGFDYIDRGEDISASDLDMSDEEFQELVEAEVVMEEDRYNVLFPEADEGERQDQAAGTPSNLEEIEGTDLEADTSDLREDGADQETPTEAEEEEEEEEESDPNQGQGPTFPPQ